LYFLQDVSALKTSLAPTTTQSKSASVVEEAQTSQTDTTDSNQVTEKSTSAIETAAPQQEPTTVEKISSTETSSISVPTTVAADT
jgi:hypothetical protein